MMMVVLGSRQRRLQVGRAMMVRHLPSGNERINLEECLKELSRDRGVWRDDLVSLLRGDLYQLQRYWRIELDDGLEVARDGVTAVLTGHIQNLYPHRWNRQLLDEEAVHRYRSTVQIAFNVNAQHYAEVGDKNLSGRQSWQAKDGPIDLRMSVRTVRRDLDQAIEQIAERMVAGTQSPRIDADAALSQRSAADALPEPRRFAFSPEALTANLLVLSGEVEPAMEAARSACRERNRQFYTSDTLLALLDMPNGRVRDCFALDGAADWSRQVRQKLLTMSLPDGDRFAEFKWIERKEFHRALQYATSDGSPVVNEFHLLLAIFDGTSETNANLQRLLQHDYAKVRAAVERRRGEDGHGGNRTPMWQ
ncbi:hypothetical protein ABZ345_45400 [Lentzea sp. NPDC005914]|uniref:hypothetical protein n=1 Tax=Lentzea sp. NPDC005914 TaxID=3154572 RepID=UPI0033C37777